jgi:hypothetical protein
MPVAMPPAIKTSAIDSDGALYLKTGLSAIQDIQSSRIHSALLDRFHFGAEFVDENPLVFRVIDRHDDEMDTASLEGGF